jgi:TrmH RNA methyltransferase
MSRNSRTRYSTTPQQKRRGKSDRRKTAVDRSRESITKFYGVQACKALFQHRRNEIRRVFVQVELQEELQELLDWSDRRGIPHKVVESEELSKVAATEHHEGVCCEAKSLKPLAVSALMARLDGLKKGCVLVLEGVENPHNVGAILRTACFFGVQGVVLISQQVSTLSGATCRVAEGAAETVPVVIARNAEEILTPLKTHGYTVVATTPHKAQSIYAVSWPHKVAVLFGAEGPGLSEAVMEAARERVVVPRMGSIESLNVGAAVASVLTEIRRPG